MAILPSLGKPSAYQFGVSRLPPRIEPITPQASIPFQLHNTAVQQQAGDYSGIMQGYQNLLNQGPSAASNAAMGNLNSAVSNLQGLSTSGGLSDADAANIRARGISPIRSIYSSANRDVDRQRSLQGGFSPNYSAVKAKMARELSDTIANKSTDIEGMIAEMRQKGKLGVAGQYASAAGQQTQAAAQQDSYKQNALQGMTSLYGTTPALANLYGNQAMQGAQFQNTVNQQGKQNNLDLISRMISGLR